MQTNVGGGNNFGGLALGRQLCSGVETISEIGKLDQSLDTIALGLVAWSQGSSVPVDAHVGVS